MIMFPSGTLRTVPTKTDFYPLSLPWITTKWTFSKLLGQLVARIYRVFGKNRVRSRIVGLPTDRARQRIEKSLHGVTCPDAGNYRRSFKHHARSSNPTFAPTYSFGHVISDEFAEMERH